MASTYGTAEDVRGNVAQYGGLSSSTVPTAAQADRMREDVSAEIDAAVAANGFAVPVTSPPAAVRLLRAIEINGATAAVLRARFPQASGPGSDGAAWKFFEERYTRGLARLESGVGLAELLGGSGSEASLPDSYHTAYVDTAPDLGDLHDAAVANPLDVEW